MRSNWSQPDKGRSTERVDGGKAGEKGLGSKIKPNRTNPCAKVEKDRHI